jgi:Gpi18-like mannosyltransferase
VSLKNKNKGVQECTPLLNLSCKLSLLIAALVSLAAFFPILALVGPLDIESTTFHFPGQIKLEELHSPPGGGTVAAAGLCVLLFGASFAALRLFKGEKPWVLVLLLGILLAGFLVRAGHMRFVSHDYAAFLDRWMNVLRRDGLEAFASPDFSDYNMPYLYFLYLFSRFSVYSLIPIKLLSIVFDIVLVIAGTLLIRHLNGDKRFQIAAAAVIWLYPIFWLNSSMWAQCDSIYTAFCVLALLFALKDRPWLSVSMAAAAFAFKLQTVFFLPIYFILLIYKKVKVRHAFIFPPVFALTFAPALLAGTPFSHLWKVYLEQASKGDRKLQNNAPSIFAFADIDNIEEKFSSTLTVLGILAAASFTCLLIGLAWLCRKRLDDRKIVLFTAMLCVGIPYLLPKMHDRYFYLADMFGLCMVLVLLAALPPVAKILPGIMSLFLFFGSFSGYSAYLYMKFFLQGAAGFNRMEAGGLMMGTAFVLGFGLLMGELLPKNELPDRHRRHRRAKR